MKLNNLEKIVQQDIVGTPSEFRTLLVATAVGILKGEVNAAQANAIASLSSELHKSVRTESELIDFMKVLKDV